MADSILRGRWCDACGGKGHTGQTGGSGGRLRECNSCHWVGFIGLTPEQVRQAEIDERRSALHER